MNKAGIENENKYPLTTQNLAFIQDIIFSVAKLSEIGGRNYILSGCRQSGTSVTEGIIVINGEIMPFNGGTAGSTIIIVEEKGSTTADGHTYADARIKRYARFGTGAVTYPWADFKPLATNTQLKQEKADITYVDEKFGLINDGAIPTGAIVMWSGSEAKIPTGWTLCDGKTLPSGLKVPDLRGRFVVGYDSTEGSDYTSIGPGTKSPKEYNLTSENMPGHMHRFQNFYYIEETSDTTGADGTIPCKKGDVGSGKSDDQNSIIFYKNWYTESFGSKTPFDARPPYYVLAYIIKI